MNSSVRLLVPISTDFETLCGALSDAIVSMQLSPPYSQSMQLVVDELFGITPLRYPVQLSVNFPRGPVVASHSIVLPQYPTGESAAGAAASSADGASALSAAALSAAAPPNLLQTALRAMRANEARIVPAIRGELLSPMRVSSGRAAYRPTTFTRDSRLAQTSRSAVAFHVASSRCAARQRRLKQTQLIRSLNTTACKQSFQCSICLNDVNEEETIAVLSCAHKFHRKCIVPWLESSKDTCPLCRSKI